MKFPGLMMLGAQSRLLPPSVPFRFFVAAVAFHVMGWVLLAIGADQVAGFLGGPGIILSALHALTLGVLLMTVIGASIQILPVATGQPLRGVWPCRLVFWLYVPGVLALLHAFAAGDYLPMAAGGVLTVAGLLVYGGLVADLLARTPGMRLFAAHQWSALAALAGLAILGCLLIDDVEHAFLPDREGAGIAHLVVAVYGFMGMTALGYSHILMPMFALSSASAERPGYATLVLAVAGLVAATVGALAGVDALLVAAAVAGLIAVVLHVWSMNRTLRQGMRRRLGVSFVLVRTAWVCLPASLAVGGLTVAGLAGDAGAALFGLVALGGWLLTFVLGVLQRIIPFLAAMNAAKGDEAPPLLSEMAGEKPMKVHAVFHFAALVLVGAGIVLDNEHAVFAGALSGTAGALVFLWFTLDVLRRMAGYGKPASEVETTPS